MEEINSSQAIREWLHRTGLKKWIVALVADIDPSYASKYISEGGRIASHRVKAIHRAVRELNLILTTPGSIIPNWRQAESILAAVKYVRTLEQKNVQSEPGRIFAVAAPLPTGARGMGSASVGFEDSAVEGSFETESD